MTRFEQRVRLIILKIPKGKVTTYGQVSALAGSPRAALAVGRILRNSAHPLPWQRVINSRGRLSIQNMEYPAVLQKELLEQEGILVTEKDRSYYVDLKQHLWNT